jgi:formylmethanofuran dehydrogenase subunit E
MCEIGIRWRESFYADAKPIRLKEPLAEFLGAVNEGEEFIYTYQDAVKLAGHSCPAVSGAYKITEKALYELYGDKLPVRGEISVRVLGKPDNGANGPMAQVISLITGAATETGFSGLGQKFGRKGKLVFDMDNEEPNTFVFTRDDNQKKVKVSYHPENIPTEDRMGDLITKCIVGTATEKQLEDFKKMWQKRVRIVLFEEAKGLFRVRKI